MQLSKFFQIYCLFLFSTLVLAKSNRKLLRLHSLACGYGKHEDRFQKLTKKQHCVTHKTKYKNYREDAATIYKGPEIEMLSVADGVGGWLRRGIDSGTFSGGLMKYLKNQIKSLSKNNVLTNHYLDNNYDPINIINKAYKNVLDDKKCQGSSTLVTAHFNKFNGILQTTNLGDSGFLILNFGNKYCVNEGSNYFSSFLNSFGHGGDQRQKRSLLDSDPISVGDSGSNGKQKEGSEDKIHTPPPILTDQANEFLNRAFAKCSVDNNYKLTVSEDQLHGFNFPYQITFQPHERADYPKDSDVSRIQMNLGDIIVLASDGVLDNLFPKDIENILLEERNKFLLDSNVRSNKNRLKRSVSDGNDLDVTDEGFSEPNSEMLVEDESEPEFIQKFLENSSLRILSEARRLSWMDDYLSPFSVKARESDARYRFESGGKVDDTTVIVALVGYE